jgi:hypothetical protein
MSRNALVFILAVAACDERVPEQRPATPKPPPVATVVVAPPADASITEQLDQVVGGHGREVEKLAASLDGKPWTETAATISKTYKAPMENADGTRVWADPEQFGMICTMIIGKNQQGKAHLVTKTTTDPGPGGNDPDFKQCLRAKLHARGM